jgi:hypothetical protein
MADLGGEPLDRGSHDAERREVHGVPVAGNDLRGDGLDAEAHPLRHVFLDPGSMLAKVPTAPEIAQVATSCLAAIRRSFARSNSA